MNDKNYWITKGIKISFANTKGICVPSPRTTMIQKQKHIILNIVKIIIKVVKEARKQHYCRLIAKSNNKIKINMEHYKERDRKVHSMEQFPTLLVNDEK
jgi:hypothetical protein